MNMKYIQLIALLLVLTMAACGGGAGDKPDEKEIEDTINFSEASRLLAVGKKQVERADSLHVAGASVLAEQAAEEGFSTLVNLSKQAPSYRNASVAMMGHAAFLNRKYPEAITLLKEALELNDRDVNSLMWLGMAFLSSSQPDSARNYISKSINAYDQTDHRARVVKEIYTVGRTSYEYGVSYGQDGYPQRGFDYRVYGTYVSTMAWELDKDDSMPEIKSQILAYANVLLPEAKERDDLRRIDFLKNIITQLNEQ